MAFTDFPAKKKKTVSDLAEGKIQLLIGTRTAVFLPFAKLKTAIIHADRIEAYRNEEREPLYNAADVLQWRMEYNHGVSALLSPYPSVENYGHGISGKYVIILQII